MRSGLPGIGFDQLIALAEAIAFAVRDLGAGDDGSARPVLALLILETHLDEDGNRWVLRPCLACPIQEQQMGVVALWSEGSQGTHGAAHDEEQQRTTIHGGLPKRFPVSQRAM